MHTHPCVQSALAHILYECKSAANVVVVDFVPAPYNLFATRCRFTIKFSACIEIHILLRFGGKRERDNPICGAHIFHSHVRYFIQFGNDKYAMAECALLLHSPAVISFSLNRYLNVRIRRFYFMHALNSMVMLPYSGTNAVSECVYS